MKRSGNVFCLTRAKAGRLFLVLLSTALLWPPLARASAPSLNDISPSGGQRGTELEATFAGDRLQDALEVLCYEPGMEVLKLNLVTNALVRAQLKLSPDCPLGEHHLR